MRKNTLKKILSCLIIVGLFQFVDFGQVKATTSSDLQKQKDYYAAQAQAATAQAAQKQKDAEAIKAQLNSLNDQMADLQTSLSSTKSQIDTTQANIDKLEAEIKTQEDNLAVQKKKMNDVISSWYMQGETGLFEALLSSNNISEVVVQQQYYESLKQQINSLIDQINQKEADLANQKNEQNAQLSFLNEQKNTQVAQQNTLQQNQQYKNRLLSNDKSAIADLNAQAAAASAQVAKLQKQIEDAYRNSGGGSKSTGPVIHGPSSMTITYYSQNDSRWASKTLGQDGPNLDAAGCLITSIAMVATSLGMSENPATLTDKSSFEDRTTTSNSNSWGNFRGFKNSGSMGDLTRYQYSKSTNYSTIDSELSKGYPVIVGVNLPTTTHFIVLTGGRRGNYSWYDPYTEWASPKDYNQYNFFSMRTFD